MAPEKVARIERHAVQAWPAPVTEEVDGWLLRHTPGMKRLRASAAALPLGTTSVLRSSLQRVETFYADRNAPAAVQVTPAAQHTELDQQLATRGYQLRTPIQVLTTTTEAATRAAARGTAWGVGLADRASDVWLAAFAELDGDDDSADVAEQVVSRIALPACYASVRVDDQIIGVGLVVGGDDEWAGVYCMATHPEYRRRGVGRAVLRAGAGWAVEHGAAGLYLQVADANAAALQVYRSVGFSAAYDYHYRVGRSRPS